MIEYRKKSDVGFELYIDGARIDERKAELNYSRIPPGHTDEGVIIATIKDDETIKKLLSHSFSELPQVAIKISFKFSFDWFPYVDNICIESEHFNQSYAVHFNVWGLEDWQEVYSLADYYQELFQVVSAANDSSIQISVPNFEPYVFLELSKMLSAFTVIFRPTSPYLPIADEVSRFSDLLHRFHREAIRTLNSRIRSESLIMYFDFPDEVSVPCEQYLLYFGQFLKDLGVEAKTEIQHDAGKVLFAVTPVDKQTALDKIQTALETYLQLPSNPAAGDASMIEYEVAVQRLAANVDHLKGQLRLAHAELRLASATIQTQEVTIDRLLSGDVIVESLKHVTLKPKEDKEELLSGTVALTKVNWRGVEFNLPEIFRRLRRLFKEDES